MPGDINCINGSKEKNVLEVFYKLIKAYSKERIPIAYLVASKQHGKQNLYLRYDYVSQSKPLTSLEEIDFEIKRMVTHYENPIIFIKDFFKISNGSNYWQALRNDEFKESSERLKVIAQKYKVTIYTTMFFDSEDILKQYYLLFDTKGNGLIRKNIPEFYFAKQYCLNSSKDSSYKARQNLHQQLILEHEGLKMIEKKIIVASGVSQGDSLWFKSPFPHIIVGTTFFFDKRIIPEDFKGYNVVRASCALPPKRYFTRDKSVPVEEKYSPENLINFVENHLEYISWKLKRPELTKEEALDALTGGFKWHVEECNRLKKKRRLT
jgi:hypothetical protein